MFGTILSNRSFVRFIFVTALGITQLSIPAVGAGAGNVEAEVEPSRAVEEITVVGRWENLLGKSMSASAGVFGQTEIEERPILRTGEILELVPGMIMTQHSGSGKSNQMFLRGFNLDHGTDFATWVDGMPVNMRTHGHGQGYTDVNFLIEELVERVEFNKGPYDVSVSDFSSAGAARMQTSRSLDAGIAKATVGEYGYQRVVLADSLDVGNSTLLLAGETKNYSGPWEDVDEDLDSFKGLARVSYISGNGDSWEAAFMGYDASWNSADQIPRRAVDQGLISDLGSLDTTVGGDTSRYSLSGSWTREDTDSRWRARTYAISYEMNLLSNFTYFLDDPINGDQFQQVDDRRIYGGDLAYTRYGSAMGREMGQTIGVEVRR
ncbi:MAG: TonB-dependent receptor [Gammaproteobacteria bacterium]|jgi:outer membrane receptor protein involved in Fe transport